MQNQQEIFKFDQQQQRKLKRIIGKRNTAPSLKYTNDNTIDLVINKGRKFKQSDKEEVQKYINKVKKQKKPIQYKVDQEFDPNNQQNFNNLYQPQKPNVPLFCVPTEIFDQYPVEPSNKQNKSQIEYMNQSNYSFNKSMYHSNSQQRINTSNTIQSHRKIKENNFQSSSNLFKSGSNFGIQNNIKIRKNTSIASQSVQHLDRITSNQTLQTQQSKDNILNQTPFTSFRDIYEKNWQADPYEEEFQQEPTQAYLKKNRQIKQAIMQNSISSSQDLNKTSYSRFFNNDNKHKTKSSYNITQNLQNKQFQNKLNFNQTQSNCFNIYLQEKHQDSQQYLSNKAYMETSKMEMCSSKVKIKDIPVVTPKNAIDQEKEKDIEFEQQIQIKRRTAVFKPDLEAGIQKVPLFWTIIRENYDWKAESREGASLVASGQHLILMGGFGIKLFTQPTAFDYVNYKWIKIEKDQSFNSETQNYYNQGLSGMTAHPYKGKVLYFGGEKNYNTHLKLRQCYHDFTLFCPQNLTWERLNLVGYGHPVIARRNHCSVLLNEKILIYYGGINSNGKYINDFCCLNLEQLKNINLDVECEPQDNPNLAFSAMCDVFKADIKIDSCYAPYEYKTKLKSQLRDIKHEGIYIFGGRTSKGKALDTLRILKLGQKPLKLQTLEPLGLKPAERYGHSMNFYIPGNFLVVHGGKDDKQDVFFQDTHLLNLHNLSWIEVKPHGNRISPKCMHSSTILDSKLVVFGGINDEGLVNSDLYMLELDDYKAQKLIKIESVSVDLGKNYTPIEDIRYDSLYHIHMDQKNKYLMKKAKQQEELPHKVLKQLDQFDESIKNQTKTFQPVKGTSLIKDVKQYFAYSDVHDSIVVKEQNPFKATNSIQYKANKQLINQFLSQVRSNSQINIMSSRELDLKNAAMQSPKHDRTNQKNQNNNNSQKQSLNSSHTSPFVLNKI